MSRGPGLHQRRILAAVERRREVYASRLLWQLAEAHDGLAGAAIRPAFYAGYWRALRRLVRSGRLRSRKRRLTSIRELVRFYPDRARSADVRAMRASLLPVVARMVRETPNDLEAERRVVASQPAGLRRALQHRRVLEDAIAAAFPRASPEVRRTLVQVMAKVSEYLDTDCTHRVARPLRQQLDGLRTHAKRMRYLQPTVSRLTEFCDRLLPRDLIGPANIKAGLWGLAAFARSHDGAKLRGRARDRLFRLAPDIVSALPGHVARDPMKHESMARYAAWVRLDLPPDVSRYSPLLDRLLGKDAFGWFEFVALAPRRGPP